MKSLDRMAAEKSIGRELTDDEFNEYMRLYNAMFDENGLLDGPPSSDYVPDALSEYCKKLRSPTVH